MPAAIPLTPEEEGCYRLLRRYAFPEYKIKAAATARRWREKNPRDGSLAYESGGAQ